MALRRTIPELPAATAITEDDRVLVSQEGRAKGATVRQMVDAVDGVLTDKIAQAESAVASAAGYAAQAFAATPVGYDEFYRRQMLDHILRTDPPALHLDFLNQKYRVNQQDKAWADLFTFSGAGGGTRVNPLGAIEAAVSGSPRFDYDPVTRKPLGLLAEESRTNLLLYSSDFNSWTKTRCTVTSDAVNGPDGATTADKLVDSVDNNSHYVARGVTLTDGTVYTFSVFAKQGERSWLTLYNGSMNTWFNLSAGALGYVAVDRATSASIVPIGNGWYRCSITFTQVGTGLTTAIGSAIIDANNVFAGDGTSGLYLWGAQLEAGAFATSYIPTTSAAVTRANDSCKIDSTRFSSWYRQDEGALVVVGLFRAAGDRSVFGVTDGGSVNYIASNSLAGYNARVQVGGVAQFSPSMGITVGSRQKLSLAYRQNDFAASLNGLAVVVDAAGSVPVVSQMAIGSLTGASSSTMCGHVEAIYFWPRRLDNATLQILSTL